MMIGDIRHRYHCSVAFSKENLLHHDHRRCHEHVFVSSMVDRMNYKNKEETIPSEINRKNIWKEHTMKDPSFRHRQPFVVMVVRVFLERQLPKALQIEK